MGPSWRLPWIGFACASVAWLALAVGVAQAAELFEVTGVRVVATAEDARAAQQKAIYAGQVQAVRRMFEKLTLVTDHSRLPPPDGDMINRLVRSYEVTNERRSAKRYIAEMTVQFQPDAVRAALRQYGVPYAETVSPLALVLPVVTDSAGARLWASPNDWRAAWQDLAWRGHLTDLALPYGELADVSTIAADQAATGDLLALKKIADRYAAADVLVMMAWPDANSGRVSVEVRRYGADAQVLLRDSYALDPQAPDATGISYVGAAAAVARQLDQAWIAQNLLDFRAVNSLSVEVPLGELGAWLSVRRRLEALSQIDRIDIASLSTAKAELTLSYLGTESRFLSALAAREFELVESESGLLRLEDRVARAGTRAMTMPAAGGDAVVEPSEIADTPPIPEIEPEPVMIDDLLVE